MARTVTDVAVLWEVMSGQRIDLPAGSLKVVFAPLSALPALEPEVAAAYAAALEALRGIAAGIREAQVPPFASFDVPRSTVLTWEALQVHRSHGWWPARANDYTEETRGYLSRAEKTLTPDAVEEARAKCRQLAGQFVSALDSADVLVTPTVPCVAPTHEEAALRSEEGLRRPVVMRLTRIPGPVNVAGLAALSLPCGLGAGGLPVGLQLIGRDEESVLRLGAAYEGLTHAR
jgi:aspartyl-tRNA(Asn)/glutamyl-tRNA(Gln) amidotransferase subunit A